jgi:hypothetical protein
MDEIIETIKYKNCLIEVYPDYNYQENPNDWQEDIQLVNYHSDFHITSNIITEDETANFYRGVKIPQEKEYFIFAVSALIHGGVWLSLNDYFTSDAGGWDTSHVGLILVKKTMAKSRQKAKEYAEQELKIWNYLNEGSVYGYISTDEKNGIHIASCGGFIGDYKEQGMIDEAKNEIDSYIKNERKKAKEKTKDFSKYTLGQFLSSNNETIKRNAISILKMLQSNS